MSDRDKSDSPEDGPPRHEASLSELSESTAIINTDMLKQAGMGLVNEHQPCLLVIAGPHVGRMYKIDQDELILGRSAEVDVELNDAGISRRHARIVRRGDHMFVEDLHSANGTYINGRRINADCQLQQGDKLTLGSTTILKFTYQDELDESFQRQMFDAALRDELTGAFNKKYMMSQLRAELSRALRQGSPLSLLMFDLDHFKHTNDTYGHLAGDHILARIGEIAREATSEAASFVRYGGEEFAVICKDTGLEDCARLGNRIRKQVERTDFAYEGQPIDVTISVGVSGIPAVAARTPADLIAAADEALYAAKDAGRNRVMVKSS